MDGGQPQEAAHEAPQELLRRALRMIEHELLQIASFERHEQNTFEGRFRMKHTPGSLHQTDRMAGAL